MANSDRFVDVLWELFRPDVASGEPVYFCFSQDLLQDHFARAGIEGSIREHIRTSARSCFEVAGAKVHLTPGALEAAETRFSKAILLVCQQVLAVEEMLAEGVQYSENAYFPRLRALMTPELPLWSANPFSFDEFESIWKTFAREVRTLEGSSQETITFEFDAYEGVNKARQFPLSQALFSSGDLHSLIAHARQDGLRSASANEVWDEIRRERHRLTRRAHRLINSGFLRERLIEQTQRYADRLLSHNKEVFSSDEDLIRSASLFISLDLVDGFREEYFAFLVSDDTGRRVENPTEVTKRIDSILGRRGYVFCPLNKLGDCWTFCAGEIDVAPGNAVILLAREKSVPEGKEQLTQCCPSVEWDDSRVRCLGADGDVHVWPVVLQNDLTDSIRLKNGLPTRDHASVRVGLSFAWQGGLCLDSRSNKYLFPYLPTTVRFGDTQFALADMQRASGTRMDWQLFVSSVARLTTDCQFDIQFAGGFQAKLAIGISRSSITERVGFMFDAIGNLSPTLERLGTHDPAIVGFSCPPQRIERPADIRTVARLLRDLQFRTGRALSEKEVQVAQSRVKMSSTPASVKRVVIALLQRNPLVTDEVMNELCQ